MYVSLFTVTFHTCMSVLQLVGSFRLEDECIAYMSKHLLTVGTTEEFRELVCTSYFFRGL